MLSLFRSQLQQPIIPDFNDTASSPIISIVDKQDKLSIRNMLFADLLDPRYQWTQKEGWPAVKHALPAVYSIDPTGFYCLEKNDVRVAMISTIAYPEISLAYIGFYIVPKELRDNGYGKYIFNEVLQHTTKTRDIQSFGLNCIPNMSPMYEKWGFETITVDDIWKLNTTINNTTVIDTMAILENIDQKLFADLVAYDATIFGTKRESYLHNYLNKPNTATLIYSKNGVIEGYGVISERVPANPELHNSYRIGPLYAANSEISKTILEQLIAVIHLKEEESIFLETPGNNPEASNIVKNLGFSKLVSMHKMYRGSVPSFDIKSIFCYSSLVAGG